MKWTIGACSHETNTFSSVPTDLDAFRAAVYAAGDQVLATYSGTATPVGGFLEAIRERGDEAVLTVVAEATPSGLVTRGAYETIAEQILAGVSGNLTADGVLLSLHGSMAAEGIDDVEGDLLLRLREAAGPHMPIVVVLDLHANVTEAMVEAATVLIGFQEYPHTDMFERGMEAAELIRRVAADEVRPVPALSKPPLIPCCGTCNTKGGLYRELWAEALGPRRAPHVLSTSLFAGFPYADVPFMGFGVLVYGDADAAGARAEADRLTNMAWQRRREFLYTPTTIADAVSRAREVAGRPVVIADAADNPGGGAANDSVEILREMLRQGVTDAAVATVYDPDVVRQVAEAGIGATLSVTLGAKTDDRHGVPIHVDARVQYLFDGDFEYKGPMNRGARASLGASAVLDVGGIRVIVNSARVQPWDPEVFRVAGIDPLNTRILVVKSSVHFRAAFEPIAASVIVADGPGLTGLDLQQFDYTRIRRPMFPLDDI